MPKFIFVTGATGSGKSTVAEEIQHILVSKGLTTTILNLDHYYLPLSQMPKENPNYDVPEALERELIKKHMTSLEQGQSIERPTFDMISGNRLEKGSVNLICNEVIIIEGIFAGEYVDILQRQTARLRVYCQAAQLLQNYSRKAERDAVERQHSEAFTKAMKKNQMQCFFGYISKHSNSAEIVVDNTWQPVQQERRSSNKTPMIVGEHLTVLLKFVGFESKLSLDIKY